MSTRSPGAGGNGRPGDRQSHLATAIVADGIDTLMHLLEIAAVKTGDHRLEGDGRRGSIHAARARIGQNRPPLSLAFVYPGLGSHFAGMGRELSAIWPEVLRRLDAESGSLRDQLDPCPLVGPDVAPDLRLTIGFRSWGACGSAPWSRKCSAGFGVNPRAAIGYSMGESTALVALRSVDRSRAPALADPIVIALPERAGRPLRSGTALLGAGPERAGRLGRGHRFLLVRGGRGRRLRQAGAFMFWPETRPTRP